MEKPSHFLEAIHLAKPQATSMPMLLETESLVLADTLVLSVVCLGKGLAITKEWLGSFGLLSGLGKLPAMVCSELPSSFAILITSRINMGYERVSFVLLY